MKNVKVGNKILLCFSAIILIIAIVLGITLFTSITRTNDLNRTDALSDLQRNANGVMDNINQARIELRTVYTSSGDAADAAYVLAMDYLDAAHDGLASLREATGRLDAASAAPYLAANDQLALLLEQLMPLVDEIHQNDLQVVASIDRMHALSENMDTQTRELFELVTQLTMDVALEDPELTVQRIETIVLPAQRLNSSVKQFMTEAENLLLLQDVSNAATLTAHLDAIVEQTNDIYEVLTTDEGRTACDEVLDAITDYRAEAQTLLALIESSDSLTVEARAVTTQLEATIVEGVTTINGEVDNAILSVNNSSTTAMWITVVAVVVAILSTLVLAFLLSKLITRPLDTMMEVLVQAGDTGDLNFNEETIANVKKEAEAKDELGQSLAAFAKMMDRMVYIGEQLTLVSKGDLTADIPLLGERDTMGTAMNAMITNLNEMFSEINSVAGQVATASSEIAMGAQTLAQGSTEQASTVEEISASVNEITEQMNTSNDTATGAANQGVEISNIATDGSNKMGQMMQAVQEINDASAAIGQVIKVIDDIAFQTNILALNAAVEAARAGEHGKGFAVVADEVRNLAGKSADAAKETANLISANIEKAELGLSISQDTAESLSKIIEGIQSTSDSLQLLANQSQQAKAATAQVNLAVDQVAQVVQQNSATSEESAAASEEMSSQAQVLQQLIARFKLKDAPAAPIVASASLLPAGQAAAAPALPGSDIIF